jgi:hypothetical protein
VTQLVELLVGSTWTDITSDVYTRDEIEITRGKADESGQAAPSSCFLTLNNRSGKYSPRNPLSPYFGQIGRNTQIRVAKQVDAVYDAQSNASGTGDLSWTHTPVGAPTGVAVIILQLGSSAHQIASVTYGGVAMSQAFTFTGTLGAVPVWKAVYFLGRNVPAGAQSIVVDTTATTLRQAGAISVTGGSGTEIDNTASGSGAGSNPSVSLVLNHRAMIFGGMLSSHDAVTAVSPGAGYTQVFETDLGTEVSNYERAVAQDPAQFGVAWVAASADWTIFAVAIRAVSYRFWGEVSSFPARWDTSGNDAWVPIECAGLLRRLGQGTDPAEGGLRAFILNSATLFRYWPLSGSVGTQFSLDIAPVWGGDSGFKFFGQGTPSPSFRYGEPMGSPYLGTGMALFNTDFGFMRGNVGNGYNYWAFDFVFQAPELGDLDVFFFEYAGDFWTLNLDGGTGVAQVSYTESGTGPIGFSPTGVLPELQDDQPHHVRIKFLKNGTGTDWTLYIDGNVVDSGTQPSYVIPGLATFQIGYARTGTQTWVNLAHLAVWADSGAELWPTAAEASQAAQGYVGEAAGDRIERIADLAGYTLTAVGTLSDTAVMGPQFSEAMLTQMRDAETTDFGVLAEPRDAFGLLYRTHRSLFNQDPALTLFYADGHLSPPFEPVDDDQLTRNDMTAVRREGDSYRVQQTTGPLSVSAPPDGVGRYKDEVTVNVETDDMLPAVAGWLLHLGTLDEARYPSVRVNLAAPDVVAVDLEEDVLAVDIGDRILIRNAIDVNIYDDVSLIVLGYTETIGPVEHTLTFNCAPGTSYEVVELDDPTSRISPGDASTLTSSLTTTATSMSVTSTAGTLWTTSGGQMPISLMVGGEEMTATAISGAASPQTFTVTRSVNGVVKTHAAGEVVRLKRRAVWAL